MKKKIHKPVLNLLSGRLWMFWGQYIHLCIEPLFVLTTISVFSNFERFYFKAF